MGLYKNNSGTLAPIAGTPTNTINGIQDNINKNGAKNLLPNNAVTTTVNGITFTVNDDGSITANGTATGDDYTSVIDFATNIPIKKGTYIFSGLSDGSTATYSAYVLIDGHYYTVIDSPLTFTVSQDTTITRARFTVRKGQTVTNATLYPMVRLATDTDSTYQPYAETNYQLTQDKMSYADNGILGAKNLLPNKAVSQTLNGITWTIGTDGSITANGTATANSEFDLVTDLSLSGNFIFSDGIAGISGQYWMFAMVDDSSDLKILTSTEMPITVTSKINYVRVKVFSGATVNNIKFYPMLRLASDTDSTYQPYAMTNRALTEVVTQHGASMVTDTLWTTTYNNQLVKNGGIGNLLIGGITASPVSVVPQSTVLAKLPIGYRPIEPTPVNMSARATTGGDFENLFALLKPNGDIVSIHGSQARNLQYFMICGSYGILQ